MIELDRGGGVVGWHHPYPDRSAGPVMIFFHGNGENLETMKWAGIYERLTGLQVPLLVVDYPGYGRSSGRPSEEALRGSAMAALGWIADRYPGRPIVPCGWSLGAALALYLAADGSSAVRGAVALSPWSSLPDVARMHFPGWLVSISLREEYDSLAAAERIDPPVLVMHGTADRIIPIELGKRVAARLRQVTWVPVEGAGHNDLLSFPVVWGQIGDFLSTLRAASQPVK